MEINPKLISLRSLTGNGSANGSGSESGPPSGAAMDRKIEKKKVPAKAIAMVLAAVIGTALLGALIFDRVSERSLTVNQERIVIAPVSLGVFEDYVPVRGRVTPLKTVFLDAMEGGRVERRLVEDGAMVKAGDLIAVLSNLPLQLDVARNEAMATEQLNNMRTIELQLEQNRLQHRRSLVDLDYQIQRLNRLVDRRRALAEKRVLSESELQDAEDELAHYVNLRNVSMESQQTDARLQETQLAFLRASGQQLERNVAIARSNLDSLNIRAPVDGKLSGFDVEVGQSMTRGARLGQIDDAASFKLRAEIDEFYLGRIDMGQTASFDIEGDTYQVTVAKIYPDVRNGQFEIDLVFGGDQPTGIRRGQSIQMKLTLGDAASALLIPNGPFYQDTGGNWIFVVSASGADAAKRSVRLGRRNARFIEVLDGLAAGERVITSSYSSFTEMDRLDLAGE